MPEIRLLMSFIFLQEARFFLDFIVTLRYEINEKNLRP